jgi:hypothetical protein
LSDSETDSPAVIALAIQTKLFADEVLGRAGDEPTVAHAAGALAMGVATSVFLEITTAKLVELLHGLAQDLDGAEAPLLAEVANSVGIDRPVASPERLNVLGLAAEFVERLADIVDTAAFRRMADAEGGRGRSASRLQATVFANGLKTVANKTPEGPSFAHANGALAAGFCLAVALGVPAGELAGKVLQWTLEFYSSPSDEPQGPVRWAEVELFGHKVDRGAIREVTFLGVPFLLVMRCEVTTDRDIKPGTWCRYSARAVYSVTELSGDEVTELWRRRPTIPELVERYVAVGWPAPRDLGAIDYALQGRANEQLLALWDMVQPLDVARADDRFLVQDLVRVWFGNSSPDDEDDLEF